MVLSIPVSSFGKQPRRFLPVSRLVGANLVHVLQRQPDIIEAIQQAVAEMARSEKAAIVENARQSGERMINDAKTYAAHRIVAAKKALADEMVETAVEMVMERMTAVLTESVKS